MEQIFEKFGLHWNLLVAQMVNFGILFFVLYKFAYRPILNILDKRREKIETSLKQAKDIEERTQILQGEIAKKMSEAKRQVDTMIAEARAIGENARNEILIRTNQEASLIMEKAKADIAHEKDGMMEDIKDYVTQVSVLIVEKILKDKLDHPTRQKLVIESFKELATDEH